MAKYFEVTVEEILGRTKTGREKKQKQVFLVDAVSVTDAEVKVDKNYEDAKSMIEYKVYGAKESRVIDVI